MRRPLLASVLVLLVAGCVSAEPAQPARQAPADDAGPQALFTFEQDSDVIAFWSPRTVSFTKHGSSDACTTELPDNGNMWSGPEVEQAFRADEVQRALALDGPRYAAEGDGVLEAGGATLSWRAECDRCRGQPQAITHLYGVLSTVMLNRRLVCADR